MSDFMQYQYAKKNTVIASLKRECASKELELARIKERLAEIKSQHEPLASETDNDGAMREMCERVAFYVVVGRFPGIDE